MRLGEVQIAQKLATRIAAMPIQSDTSKPITHPFKVLDL